MNKLPDSVKWNVRPKKEGYNVNAKQNKRQVVAMFLRINVLLHLKQHLGVVLNKLAVKKLVSGQARGVEAIRGEVLFQKMDHDVATLFVVVLKKSQNGVDLILGVKILKNEEPSL